MTNTIGSRPLKLFGECYPNNIWYDQWRNGTYFKSRNFYRLWEFESKFENGIEIVTNISASNQTHPVVGFQKINFFIKNILTS